MKETVSYHLLRRTAREVEQRMERIYPAHDFKVLSMIRGPWGWRVVRTR